MYHVEYTDANGRTHVQTFVTCADAMKYADACKRVFGCMPKVSFYHDN